MTIAPSLESALDVQREQQREEGDRDLPRAPVSTREASRRHDERDRERHDQRLRKSVYVCRVERGDERAAMLREERIHGREQPDARDDPRKHDPGARLSGTALSREQRSRDACEHRRDEDRLLGSRGVKGLVRGDLPDGEDRHAVHRVEPAADGESEQQASREPLCPGPAGEQPQEDGGGSPHGEVEQRRHAAVVRQLVERQGVVHHRARQLDEWAGGIQPAGHRREDTERECNGCDGTEEPGHARSLAAAATSAARALSRQSAQLWPPKTLK